MPFVTDSNSTRYVESNVSLAVQREYYNSHPPRLVAERPQVRLENESLFAFGGHGELINKAYSIKCGCGESRLCLAGEFFEFEEEEFITSPITATCERCGKSSVIFDDRIHGHDAQYDHFGVRKREPTGTTRHMRNLTGGEQLVVICHYPDDLFEFDAEVFIDGGETGGTRPEDQFTWFSIACLDSDGKLEVLFDCECA
tara:strand:- start:300 stop:896 length:597 start_codon:yes stop_codon:yes gene_type:complete